MKYDLIIGVDPGTESVLVGMYTDNNRLVDYKPVRTIDTPGCKVVTPCTPRDYLKSALYMVLKPTTRIISPDVIFEDTSDSQFIVPRTRVLVGIEDQYLWISKDEQTGRILTKFNAIKALIRSATSWHMAFGLIGIDSISVSIPSWKSFANIHGPNPKAQAARWASENLGYGTEKTADAYCIAAYLASVVRNDLIETKE